MVNIFTILSIEVPFKLLTKFNFSIRYFSSSILKTYIHKNLTKQQIWVFIIYLSCYHNFKIFLNKIEKTTTTLLKIES